MDRSLDEQDHPSLSVMALIDYLEPNSFFLFNKKKIDTVVFMYYRQVNEKHNPTRSFFGKRPIPCPMEIQRRPRIDSQFFLADGNLIYAVHLHKKT